MHEERDGNEEAWFTATSQEDGNPLIFRARQHVPLGVVESDYPTLLSVSWDYEPANESGMPNEDTNDAQIEMEDAFEELDSPGISFLMLVVTGNGRKEWHWYVSDIETWTTRLNELLAGYQVFPIQIENNHEPDWDLYHDFVSGVSGS